MENAFVYILFSISLNRFYTGSTTRALENRLQEHLGKTFAHSFTERAGDWEIFLCLECTNVHQARMIEMHIKSQKSSTYIRNLKKYPEMREKLLKRFG